MTIDPFFEAEGPGDTAAVRFLSPTDGDIGGETVTASDLHAEAAGRTVRKLLADNLLDVERDAIAITTILSIAERLDGGGIEHGDYQKLAAEARQWWTAMRGKAERAVGRSITDGF